MKLFKEMENIWGFLISAFAFSPALYSLKNERDQDKDKDNENEKE